jgi:hypothetical protein
MKLNLLILFCNKVYIQFFQIFIHQYTLLKQYFKVLNLKKLFHGVRALEKFLKLFKLHREYQKLVTLGL